MLSLVLCKCGCGITVPANRRSYVSVKCYKRYRNQNENHEDARAKLFARDGGVCSCCGADTIRMRAEYTKKLHDRFPHEIPTLMDLLHPEMRPAGMPGLRYSWWQADHELPLIEGGNSEDENYRTLCVPCHKAENKKLAARMAEKRRAGDTMEFELLKIAEGRK